MLGVCRNMGYGGGEVRDFCFCVVYWIFWFIDLVEVVLWGVVYWGFFLMG